MHALSLRDDVFLLAHDDAGRLIAAEASLGAGLAGATLIDLLLTGKVAVEEGRLVVTDHDGPREREQRAPASPAVASKRVLSDDETDATIEAIRANTAPIGPRAWVSWISHGAYERVAESLIAAEVVQRTTVRRLGLLSATRHLPTNSDDLVRVRGRVRYAIHGSQPPDASTSALCGLVRVLRLESSLLLSMPTSDLLLALERTAAHSEMTVRQVTNAVDSVIGAAASR